MPNDQGWFYELEPAAADILRDADFAVTQVLSDPRIVVWRDITERQNCLLDYHSAGTKRRLHIKRYRASHALDVQKEVAAIRLLQRHQIATVPLLCWGAHADGQSFLISADLSEHIPADRAIQEGLSFDRIATPIAQLAGRLHQHKLRHQDLYLCHFFVNPRAADLDIHLIDPGRVGRFRRPHLRCIVKDLAQLLYSTTQISIDQPSRKLLLDLYFRQNPLAIEPLVRTLLPLKIAAISRHDQRLRKRSPNRRVSIPPL